MKKKTMDKQSNNSATPAGVAQTPLTALAFSLALALSACAPSKLRPIHTAESPGISLPFVRVLLSDAKSEVTIGGEGAIAIECLRGAERFVYYSPSAIRLRKLAGRVGLVNSRGEIIEPDLEQVTVSARNTHRLLWVNGQPYRGMLRVTPGDGALQLVNVIYIEDYLRGVVPPELGPLAKEGDAEAIKAQAIAARTYTMSHLGQYGRMPYDMKSDVSDQVYSGASIEKDFISRAVENTTGEVIRYRDGFINAYYHSTCGGMTDNIENVWDKDPLPYLKSVSCNEMCRESKYYRWTETYSGRELAKMLSDYETSQRGAKVSIRRIDDISIDNSAPRTPSKGLRNQALIIKADGKTLRYERDRIRWVLRRASNPNRILQSDYFTLSNITRSKNGDITSVTLNGRGYGHGVGMCQVGALGMARAGKKYKQILTHYYTGVTIDRLY